MSEQTAPAAGSRYVEAMPIDQIAESKHNPRKHFDPEAMKELEQSIREKGVLAPLLVRPNGKGYEIAAGHRRFRAAKAVGLEALPTRVLEMTDAELLEVLVIENDQREDVHPLEEAAGYQALMKTAKYDVQRIADRIGRSAKYVYDRIKLLALTPKVQKLFLDGRMEAGHAILLARLKAEDQERAIDPETAHGNREALFEDERTDGLFEDADEEERAMKKDPWHGLKTRSVRELQQWIHDEVKFDPAHVDRFLFPETAVMVESAQEQKEKIVLITRDYRASDAVREAAGKVRIYGEQGWKRADGQEKSKTCDRSALGIVACGQGQGEAFRVCVNKDKCEVHYGADIRARQKRQQETSQGGEEGKKARERYAEEDRKRKEQQAEAEADRARVDRALPAVIKAIAAAVRKAPARAGGHLAKIVREEAEYNLHASSYVADRAGKSWDTLVPVGTRAEDLIRNLAFRFTVQGFVEDITTTAELIKQARAFGVDAKKIIDAVAPTPKVQTAAQLVVRVKKADTGRWYAEVKNLAGKWNVQGTGHETREAAQAEADQLSGKSAKKKAAKK